MVPSRNNIVPSVDSELYSYDDLNRLTSFGRGTLNSGHTSSTTAAMGPYILEFDVGFQGGVVYTDDGTIGPVLTGFQHRDYNPATGRWMQQDPAGYVDGANTYQFVTSNPVNLTDAFGLATTNPTTQPSPGLDATGHDQPHALLWEDDSTLYNDALGKAMDNKSPSKVLKNVFAGMTSLKGGVKYKVTFDYWDDNGNGAELDDTKLAFDKLSITLPLISVGGDVEVAHKVWAGYVSTDGMYRGVRIQFDVVWKLTASAEVAPELGKALGISFDAGSKTVLIFATRHYDLIVKACYKPKT